jgi:hypothetical protein
MISKQEFDVMEMAGQSILASALREEAELDAKLASMDAAMDEDTFEALRQKRKLQMQKQLRKEADLRQMGHGSYRELTDTKEFFQAAKKSSRMIVHFYRGVTPRCEIVDAHFEKLAHQHVECRFAKLNAEKNPFLVEKFGIILLPTMVLIKDGKTDHAIHGFDEFGGTDDFSTEVVAYVLAAHGMINPDTIEDKSEDIMRGNEAGVNAIKVSTVSASTFARLEDSDDDFDMDDFDGGIENA